MNEASKDTAREIETELAILTKQFGREQDALLRKHATELEFQREELRRASEEKVLLLGQIETLKLALEGQIRPTAC